VRSQCRRSARANQRGVSDIGRNFIHKSRHKPRPFRDLGRRMESVDYCSSRGLLRGAAGVGD
jgi:hypothetical protein